MENVFTKPLVRFAKELFKQIEFKKRIELLSAFCKHTVFVIIALYNNFICF